MNKKKIFSMMMVLLLCLNLGIPAFATCKNDNVFYVSVAPNNSQELNNIQSISDSRVPLEMEITLDSYEFIPNSTIGTEVSIVWASVEDWNMALSGKAYVYNENNHPIILGSVHGYNKEFSLSEFVGLDYTYDVVNQHCIATATYNYADDGSCDMLSFGYNTGEFNQAILASYNMPDLESKEAMAAPAIKESPLAANADYISEYIAEVYTKRGALQYDVWTYPEMEAGHTNHIAASVKGDATAAEYYILNLQSTAYSITPRYCEFFFACDSKGRMSTGEYLPKPEETSFEIPLSLPLKGGQDLPVKIKFTLSSMTPTAATRKTSWDAYALNGIDKLDPDDNEGIGFYNQYTYYGNLASGQEDDIYLQAHASIGYSYVYIDAESGGFNNSTWYAMNSSSGQVTVYN